MTSMRRFRDRFLALLGVDPIQFLALVRGFLLMDLRGQHFARATGSPANFVISPLFWVVGQCLALSAGLSLVLFARVDAVFFLFANLSASLLLMASTLLVEFNEVVLGPADLEVLGHRPIRGNTFAAARMVNLFFYVGLIYLALNLFPLILGAGLRDSGDFYVPAYLLGSLAGNLAVVAVVVGVVSSGRLSGRHADGRAGKPVLPESFQEMVAWTQIILLLMLAYGAQMMFRDGTHAVLVWGAFPPAWVGWLPSTWLANAIDDLGRFGEYAAFNAMVLAGILLASGSLVFLRLGQLFRKMQPVTAQGRSRPMRGGVGHVGSGLDRLLRGREERIGFWLCRTLLGRETGLKMRSLWPLNMAVAVVILGLLSGQFANPLVERDLKSIALPCLAVYLLAVAVPGIVHNLCFSREHQAVWLLLGAPLEDPAAVARGVCKAVLLLVMAPACLLFGLVAALAWQDPLAAVVHAGFAWILCWPMALVGLWLVAPDVPFSLPPVHGSAMGRLALPLAVLNLGVILGTALHCLWAGSVWFWLGALLVVLAASVLLRPQAARRTNQLWRGQS